jgi:putative transposase
MKLIAQLKLLPTPEQADALRQTLEHANAACNAMSETAWRERQFHQFAIHKLCYHAVKANFGLTAQVVVRCIAKVANSYKLDRKHQRSYRPHASIAYDDRILSWNMAGSAVSIWTTQGRQSIPFVCGERQRLMLQTRKGECDLVYRKGAFYLLAVCEVDEPTPEEVDDVIGVDLGVTNIATTSDGENIAANHVKNVRYRHRRLRTKLQRKGTLGAKRRLRQLAGQERRFATHVNHVLSKQLVSSAQRTKRGIALEDLTHIRSRVRARKSQRTVLHSWSFAQLRGFIDYKARRAGVPVVLADPRNTSRQCSLCQHIDKASRRSQALFLCTSCGYVAHADVNAAMNIRVRGRAAVNSPYCSDAPTGVAPEQSCLL